MVGRLQKGGETLNPALVLDCSAAYTIVAHEERDLFSFRLERVILDHGAIAPSLWTYEITNVVVSKIRSKRLIYPMAREYLATLRSLPICFHDEFMDAMDSCFDLSHKYNLSGYDAAYLRLALKTGLPLASCDRELNQVAAGAGVKLFE